VLSTVEVIVTATDGASGAESAGASPAASIGACEAPWQAATRKIGVNRTPRMYAESGPR
jgi:hypothetical protein